PELEKKLRSGELTEEKVSDTARSLLAAAFKGQPVPEGRPFIALNQTQQRVLRSLCEVDDYYYCVSGLLDTPLFTYGFPVFNLYHLKNYIEGRDYYDQS